MYHFTILSIFILMATNIFTVYVDDEEMKKSSAENSN